MENLNNKKATKKEIVVNLFNDGMTPDDIAKEVKTHIVYVKTILRNAGVNAKRTFKKISKKVSTKNVETKVVEFNFSNECADLKVGFKSLEEISNALQNVFGNVDLQKCDKTPHSLITLVDKQVDVYVVKENDGFELSCLNNNILNEFKAIIEA